MIVKTLIAVEPNIVGSLNKCPPGNRNSCFELYGFDVIIDESLKPWVLEVNVFPSLSSSSPFDKIVKSQLICDTFTLIGVRGYDKQRVHGVSRDEEMRIMLSKYWHITDSFRGTPKKFDHRITGTKPSFPWPK